MATLIDSNVLLDVLTEDPAWSTWSSAALDRAADDGPLLINPIIYAEISIRFSEIEILDQIFSPDDFIRTPIPWSAAFLAGKCFQRYRRSGGAKNPPLPDFFIGAHAATSRFRLLTRDARRYRTYFPSVDLIAPE